MTAAGHLIHLLRAPVSQFNVYIFSLAIRICVGSLLLNNERTEQFGSSAHSESTVDVYSHPTFRTSRRNTTNPKLLDIFETISTARVMDVSGGVLLTGCVNLEVPKHALPAWAEIRLTVRTVKKQHLVKAGYQTALLVHLSPLHCYSGKLHVTVKLGSFQAQQTALLVLHSDSYPTHPCSWKPKPFTILREGYVQFSTTKGGSFGIVVKEQQSPGALMPATDEEQLRYAVSTYFQPTPLWLAVYCHPRPHTGEITIKVICLFQKTAWNEDVEERSLTWNEDVEEGSLVVQKEVGYFFPDDAVWITVSRLATSSEMNEDPVVVINQELRLSSQRLPAINGLLPNILVADGQNINVKARVTVCPIPFDKISNTDPGNKCPLLFGPKNYIFDVPTHTVL